MEGNEQGSLPWSDVWSVHSCIHHQNFPPVSVTADDDLIIYWYGECPIDNQWKTTVSKQLSPSSSGANRSPLLHVRSFSCLLAAFISSFSLPLLSETMATWVDWRLLGSALGAGFALAFWPRNSAQKASKILNNEFMRPVFLPFLGADRRLLRPGGLRL